MRWHPPPDLHTRKRTLAPARGWRRPCPLLMLVAALMGASLPETSLPEILLRFGARPLLAQEPAAGEEAPVVVEGGEQVVRPEPEAAKASAPFYSNRFQAGARTVIGREQFGDTHKSVADVLEEVPGLTLTRSGDGMAPTRVTIRGSRSDQVLILLNGVPVATEEDSPSQRRVQSRAGFDLAAIPLAQVESIEIVRGAASSLYGAGASAGAINIRTRRPPEGELTLAGTVGSDGFREADAAGSTSLGGDAGRPQSLTVHLNHRRTDGTFVFFEPDAAKSTTTTPPEANACAVALGDGFFERRCNEKRVTALELAWYRGEAERWALFVEDYTRIGLGGVENPRPFGREERRRIRVNYEDAAHLTDPADAGAAPETAAASIGWNANLERLDSRRNENVNAAAGTFTAAFDDRRLGGEAWLEQWIGRYQGRLGAAARQQKLDDLRFTARRTTLSAYTSWTLHRAAGTWEASLRRDALSDLDPQTTYRAAFAEALIDGFGAKGSHGTGYRPPTLYELFDPGAFGDSSVANPELRPETSRSTDGGLFLELGDHLYLEALYFRQDFEDNIIAFPAPDSPNLFRFENLARTRSSGIEALANLRLPGRVTLNATWTRTDALIVSNDAIDPRDNGNRVPGVPRTRWNASLAWRKEAWHAWLQVRDSDRRFVDTANTRFLQPYRLYDAGVSFPIAWGLEASVEGKNLTNVTYAELDNFPPPGRQGFFTLRWRLGGKRRKTEATGRRDSGGSKG
ncbi:MAG: TonB-dependent receptor [SAR324 cluster bacterium]|nr:TonB-dependent receptor [SAR324 cluster bacterium]